MVFGVIQVLFVLRSRGFPRFSVFDHGKKILQKLPMEFLNIEQEHKIVPTKCLFIQIFLKDNSFGQMPIKLVWVLWDIICP